MLFVHPCFMYAVCICITHALNICATLVFVLRCLQIYTLEFPDHVIVLLGKEHYNLRHLADIFFLCFLLILLV